MAPSAEHKDDYHLDEIAPTRNVTFAVNYELSLVDQFLASQRKRRDTTPSDVESVPISTGTPIVPNTPPTNSTTAPSKPSLENKAPNVPKARKAQAMVTIQSPSQEEKTRRSTREKRRDVPLSRSRVRYDMNVVPPARRHRAFLQHFPSWWLHENQHDNDEVSSKQPRRSSRLTSNNNNSSEDNYLPCGHCDAPAMPPFEEDTSVLWIPSKRSEWEDSVSEMTAVCTSAALRHYKTLKASSMTKPFHAPLSKDYIRDRVDIDDPLNGYQIRHKSGGWLQGFILWTNFTTWTHNFKWDSLHLMSGLQSSAASSAKVDSEGSLAAELEAQPRSGDPHGEGIVFPSIAEIAVLGGLGCGEYLLRMALESIREKKNYKYVVLQATDQSKTFYERFGFVRVGAVCQYGAPSADQNVPVMGYRHWTHANESETSLEMHGGPSYMMCLKLPETESSACSLCGRQMQESEDSASFMDQMLALAVDQKPTIEQLGGSFTPGPKPAVARRNSTPASPVSKDASFGSKKKYGRVGRARNGTKRVASKDSMSEPKKKRRKPNGAVESIPREQLMSPPREGSPVSYAQKQFQSPWLAVPPASGTKPTRHPPKDRKSSPRRKNSGKNSTTVVSNKGRSFYSVRGPDGRFVTISTIAPTPSATADAPTTPVSTPPLRGLGLGRSDGKPTRIVKSELLKQKVKSYPRSRIHYFNRVVKPNDGTRQYYFVLHYDEPSGIIRIAPMVPRGRLTGKREGRPRYQVVLGETDANFLTVSTSDYQVVRATMVMKTPVVANEAWDVED